MASIFMFKFFINWLASILLSASQPIAWRLTRKKIARMSKN